MFHDVTLLKVYVYDLGGKCGKNVYDKSLKSSSDHCDNQKYLHESLNERAESPV